MDELLHFFKTKDVTNAPNILQGEPTYLPFTMRAKTLLECISTGLDKTSCTATAQIIAYWLTGKKRVFGELMEGGLQLSQWNYEDVWLAPSPQLISIDMNSHKFSVVVLPTYQPLDKPFYYYQINGQERNIRMINGYVGKVFAARSPILLWIELRIESL